MAEKLAAQLQDLIQNLVGYAAVFFIANRAENTSGTFNTRFGHQYFVKQPPQRRDSTEAALILFRSRFAKKDNRPILEIWAECGSHVGVGLAGCSHGGEIAEIRDVEQNAPR